jgi:hypothetical protein
MKPPRPTSFWSSFPLAAVTSRPPASVALALVLSTLHCSGSGGGEVGKTPSTPPSGDAGSVSSGDAAVAGDASMGDVEAPTSRSPLIVAFEAPLPSDAAHYRTFLSDVLPRISGPGFAVAWSSVDACSDAPCASEPAFDWSALDSTLMQYVTNDVTPFASGCANHRACRIVLIVQPTSDSGNDNALTPKYVFSPTYAASLTLPAPPEDVVVCKNEQGAAYGWGSAPPVAGTFGSGDTAVWNAVGGTIVSGSGLHLVTGGFPTTNFSGYPVEYEAPFRTAYENFIKNLLIHYSPAGSGDGPKIAPSLAYIRFGLHGGENDPACALNGTIPGVDWSPKSTLEPGDLVRPATSNPGGFYFVTTGAGQSGSAAPAWCQTPYCETASDGTVPAWRNTGFAPGTGAADNALWPGPEGQASQPQGFTNEAYLDFVHGLYAFLAAQHSTIPLDIASHDGPPFNGNWAFADSEAIAAVSYGLGFGNEGLNLEDPAYFAASHVPDSQHDWVENFDVYAHAPVVRHLQTAWAGGNGIQAESFALSKVTVNAGQATASCSNGDCSMYCTGFAIEIVGSSNPALNKAWIRTATTCDTGTVVFPVTDVSDGTFEGGAVFGIDYLPGILPFARTHFATTFELHECTLDYAFGVETVGSVAHACAGSPGPDSTYQALLSSLQE